MKVLGFTLAGRWPRLSLCSGAVFTAVVQCSVEPRGRRLCLHPVTHAWFTKMFLHVKIPDFFIMFYAKYDDGWGKKKEGMKERKKGKT